MGFDYIGATAKEKIENRLKELGQQSGLFKAFDYAQDFKDKAVSGVKKAINTFEEKREKFLEPKPIGERNFLGLGVGVRDWARELRDMSGGSRKISFQGNEYEVPDIDPTMALGVSSKASGVGAKTLGTGLKNIVSKFKKVEPAAKELGQEVLTKAQGNLQAKGIALADDLANKRITENVYNKEILKLDDKFNKFQKNKGKVSIGSILGVGVPITAMASMPVILNNKKSQSISNIKIPTSRELRSGETEYDVKTKETKTKSLTGSKPATLTVYNPIKEQTDATPHEGGFLTKMEFGDVAIGNRNEYNKARSKFFKDKTDTFIFIPELTDVVTPYGNGIFRVRDTMNKKYDGDNRIDIFIPKAGSGIDKQIRSTPKASYSYL